MKQMPQQPSYYAQFQGPEWTDYPAPVDEYSANDNFLCDSVNPFHDSPDEVPMLDNVENSSAALCSVTQHEAFQEEELVSQFDKYLKEFKTENEETCAAVPAKLA